MRKLRLMSFASILGIVALMAGLAAGEDYKHYEEELTKKVGGLDTFIDGILGKPANSGDGIIIGGKVAMGMSPSEVNDALADDSLSVNPNDIPNDPVKVSSRLDRSFAFIDKKLVLIDAGQSLKDNNQALKQIMSMLGDFEKQDYFHVKKKSSGMAGTTDFATEYVFYRYPASHSMLMVRNGLNWQKRHVFAMNTTTLEKAMIRESLKTYASHTFIMLSWLHNLLSGIGKDGIFTGEPEGFFGSHRNRADYTPSHGSFHYTDKPSDHEVDRWVFLDRIRKDFKSRENGQALVIIDRAKVDKYRNLPKGQLYGNVDLVEQRIPSIPFFLHEHAMFEMLCMKVNLELLKHIAPSKNIVVHDQTTISLSEGGYPFLESYTPYATVNYDNGYALDILPGRLVFKRGK